MLRRLASSPSSASIRRGRGGGCWGKPPSLDRRQQRLLLSSSLLPSTQDDDGQQQRSPRPPRHQHQHWLHQQRRGFRLNPKYHDEGGTLHRQVTAQELTALLVKEKLTFGGALAAIGLASACSLVIPHIFGGSCRLGCHSAVVWWLV
jgi:hypothetical protein